MKKINSKNSVQRMKFLPGMRWFCLYSYVLLPISAFFGISVFIGGIIASVDKGIQNKTTKYGLPTY